MGQFDSLLSILKIVEGGYRRPVSVYSFAATMIISIYLSYLKYRETKLIFILIFYSSLDRNYHCLHVLQKNYISLMTVIDMGKQPTKFNSVNYEKNTNDIIHNFFKSIINIYIFQFYLLKCASLNTCMYIHCTFYK